MKIEVRLKDGSLVLGRYWKDMTQREKDASVEIRQDLFNPYDVFEETDSKRGWMRYIPQLMIESVRELKEMKKIKVVVDNGSDKVYDAVYVEDMSYADRKRMGVELEADTMVGSVVVNLYDEEFETSVWAWHYRDWFKVIPDAPKQFKVIVHGTEYPAVYCKDCSPELLRRMGVHSDYKDDIMINNYGRDMEFGDNTKDGDCLAVWLRIRKGNYKLPMTLEEAMFVVSCKKCCDRLVGCTEAGCPNGNSRVGWKYECSDLLEAGEVEKAYEVIRKAVL